MSLKKQISAFWRDESGLSTVEIILILVVLIALVLIFKDEMIEIVESIFENINKKIIKMFVTYHNVVYFSFFFFICLV